MKRAFTFEPKIQRPKCHTETSTVRKPETVQLDRPHGDYRRSNSDKRR